MRTGYIIFIMIVFLSGTIISQTLEYQESLTSANCTTTFNVLLQPGFMETGAVPIIGFFIVAWEWIKVIWNALTWNYTFLIGTPWEILRYFGLAISIGIVVGIVFAIRGSSST